MIWLRSPAALFGLLSPHLGARDSRLASRQMHRASTATQAPTTEQIRPSDHATRYGYLTKSISPDFARSPSEKPTYGSFVVRTMPSLSLVLRVVTHSRLEHGSSLSPHVDGSRLQRRMIQIDCTTSVGHSACDDRVPNICRNACAEIFANCTRSSALKSPMQPLPWSNVARPCTRTPTRSLTLPPFASKPSTSLHMVCAPSHRRSGEDDQRARRGA